MARPGPRRAHQGQACDECAGHGARHAAALIDGKDHAAAGERTATLITELAKAAILAWEGVGDDKGKAAAVTPDGIAALMELWPVADAFEREYLAALYLLDAEKNG